MAKVCSPCQLLPSCICTEMVQLMSICLYVLQDVVNEVPAAKQLFQQASEILSYDLLKVCTEGKQDIIELLQQYFCHLPVWHMAASRSQGQTRLHSSEPASHLRGQPCSFGEAQARRGAGMCTDLHHIAEACSACCITLKYCCSGDTIASLSTVYNLCMWGRDCMTLQAALDAADVTGGLSLGEYTALTFAGAMRYQIFATFCVKALPTS